MRCTSAAGRAAAERQFELRSPIDRDWLLGRFPLGTRSRCGRCGAAARAAPPAGPRHPTPQRIELLRRAAALIEQRVYELAAAVALEVGKNRMEAHRRGAGDGRPDHLVLRPDGRATTASTARCPTTRCSGWRSHNRTRAQALRRVGGDRAVQLPVRAGRRADRRGAGGRQHGGLQDRQRHRLERPAADGRASTTPACRRAC